MLEDVFAVFGNRKMTLARELTKVHEEYLRGTVLEIKEVASSLKGEMVVVIEGYQEEEGYDLEQACQEILELAQTMKLKQACKQIADKYKASKNELYKEVLKRKEMV